MKKIVLIILSIVSLPIFSQEEKVKLAFYEGTFIGGFVNNGAFLNFTGPNINTSYKNSKFILGMLPSLRFKEDKETPKNAFITPGLGVGFTYTYKIWAIQIPLYYNAKTSTENGKWHIGLGIGLRLNALNKKK
jgi:hypothetical protein